MKSSLLETIFDIQEMQGYALYVFDRDTGEAVYVPEGADTLPLTRFQDSVPRGHGSYTDQIGGADCLVVYTTSEITPWQIVGVVRQNTVISGFFTGPKPYAANRLAFVRHCLRSSHLRWRTI